MAENPLARPPFESIRQIGLGGLVSKVDSQDISPTESPDLRNIIYDAGIVGPRNGTTLLIAVPAGETGTPSRLLKPRASDGKQYVIAIYGTNLYLYDPTNVKWILINGSYAPTSTGVQWDYAIWNNGKQDDRIYLGIGIDDTAMWQQTLDYLKVAAVGGDGTLTLKDSSRFPNTGTVVVNGESGAFSLAYTANNTTTGVLTLTGTVGQAVNVGDAVTMPIVDKSGMPKGNVFAKWQGRLMITGAQSSETTLVGSKAGDPETFTPGTNFGDPFLELMTTGEGAITDLQSFGSFLVVGQQDLLQQLSIIYDSSIAAQKITTSPLVSGYGMGSISHVLSVQSNNALYYPTEVAGIFELVPTTTGVSASTSVKPISDNIFPTITAPGFTFDSGKGAVFSQKLHWLCSSFKTPTSVNNQLVNNLILVYDLLYQNWSLWDNINAADLTEYNNSLLFLCSDDGGLYYYDVTSAQDFRSGVPVGYTSYIFTKRFDWGHPANAKQNSLAMLTGYIPQNTKLFVDVLYNEAGSLATSTYVIDGNNPTYVNQIPVFGIGRASLGQNPLGGFQVGTLGFFRVYLDLLYRAGAHVIQFKFYTQNIGDDWGVTGLAVNPETVENVPTELKIGIS